MMHPSVSSSDDDIPITNFDIYCSNPLSYMNYTNEGPVTFRFPGFFTLNGSNPEDVQILAVGAVFSALLINNDQQFAGKVKVKAVLEKGT
jgi:hypothetical protein